MCKSDNSCWRRSGNRIMQGSTAHTVGIRHTPPGVSVAFATDTSQYALAFRNRPVLKSFQLFRVEMDFAWHVSSSYGHRGWEGTLSNSSLGSTLSALFSNALTFSATLRESGIELELVLQALRLLVEVVRPLSLLAVASLVIC